MRRTSIFKPNGGAPSLRQVVALAQAHVSEKSRQRARQIDFKVYEEDSKPRKSNRNLTRGSKNRYEKINDKYSRFYNYE